MRNHVAGNAPQDRAPRYVLVSTLSFVFDGKFGEFESVSEATEHAIWLGLPGEEFEIRRTTDNVCMAKVTAPESKLELLEKIDVCAQE